jgi:hypothetical protein
VTPCYVALGDSMSIDLYPRLDLQGQGRVLEPGSSAAGVGAASLFHRNHDTLWPEFRGRDLATLYPGIRKLDACVDGATIGHTASLQLPVVPAEVRESAAVVTLTAGGNDLLAGLFDGIAGLHDATRDAISGYEQLVGAVLDSFPSAAVLLTTVYDPTDGTGILPGVSDQLGAALPMEHLDTFNDAVRRLAAHTPRAALADVHRHFLGHGLSAAADALWYWPLSPIEPGARGAHEIRRLWLDALP